MIVHAVEHFDGRAQAGDGCGPQQSPGVIVRIIFIGKVRANEFC